MRIRFKANIITDLFLHCFSCYRGFFLDNVSREIPRIVCFPPNTELVSYFSNYVVMRKLYYTYSCTRCRNWCFPEVAFCSKKYHVMTIEYGMCATVPIFGGAIIVVMANRSRSLILNINWRDESRPWILGLSAAAAPELPSMNS